MSRESGMRGDLLISVRTVLPGEVLIIATRHQGYNGRRLHQAPRHDAWSNRGETVVTVAARSSEQADLVYRPSLGELRRKSVEARKLIVQAIHHAGAGHLGGPLSATD